MGKDPAFLFYSSDFLSGIQDLTMEERGQYITLLCLQHQKGHLTEKMIRLCCGNATADVLAKFKLDDNGNYYNSRLEIEINKRKEHTEKQRIRAIDGWKKRKRNDNVVNATAYAPAMPLENENENKDIDVIELNTLPMFDKITNIDFLQMCRRVSDQKGRLTDLDQYKKEYFRLLANRKELHDQSGRSEEWLVINAKKFIKEQAAINKEYDNYADFFSHFLNWTRKQPK